MNSLIIFKDLVIDQADRTVAREGERLNVSDLSFDVFEALIAAAPAPVSVAQLSDTVWNGIHVSDETIAQRIALLRKALGDNPKTPDYVRTVRGAGYALAGAVTIKTEPKGASHRSLPGHLKIGLVAAAGLISLGFVIIQVQSREQGREPALTSARSEPETETALLVRRAQQQMSLHQAEETDRAIQLLRTALEQDPDSETARLALSFALSTKATKFQGDFAEESEAEAIARALISENGSNSDAWSALGYTLSAQGRSDEALAAYRQAFEFDPSNGPAMSSAAHLLLLRGDLQQSLLLDMEARKTGNPSRYSEIQIAQSLELIGHPAANEWRDRALALNPGQAVVTKEIGNSLLKRRRPEEALKLLNAYEGEDGSSPQLLVTRGRALIMLGRDEEARSSLNEAGWRGQYGLAALEARDGNPDLAERWFSAAYRVETSGDIDPDLKVQLAEVSAALGRDDEAFSLLSQAVSLGWRDVPWLTTSPFLETLMNSPRGGQLRDRINRELDAQRYLINNTQALSSLVR